MSSSEEEVHVESAYTKTQQKKLQKAQAEVDEVVDIMRDGIDKLIDRGDKLDTLLENAEGLQFKAMSFKRSAAEVKKKYWWKNTKLWVLLVVIVLLIAGIIVVGVLRPWES